MIFAKRLRSAGHTRKFLVEIGTDLGWEVREERDSRIVRKSRVRDWHRVENAIAMFSLEAHKLEREGWVED